MAGRKADYVGPDACVYGGAHFPPLIYRDSSGEQLRAAMHWRGEDRYDHLAMPVQPCRCCRRPAMLTDCSGRPCHKACAEEEFLRAHTLGNEESTMPNRAPTLPAALALAAEGYPVFLLGRSKRPVANCPLCPKAEIDPAHDPEACDHLTCHGFYAATRDPDRITAMHARIPDGLLAIRTGRVCDLAVIDIDPRNGGTIDRDLMPPTRAVRTGSDGWHLYYRHPGETLAAKLRDHPGVDIKADGGYVVAPPSIHPSTGQPYRPIGDRPVIEMPRALVELARPVEPPAASPVGTVTQLNRGEGISDPAALLAANLQAVVNAPEGTRRNTLYGAARGVARMVAAGALTADDAYTELYQAGRAAGQTDRDTRAAITGGFRAESVALQGIAA